MDFSNTYGNSCCESIVEHVQALNMIDLSFYNGNKKEKAVIEAWQNYLDHLCIPIDNMTEAENVVWNGRSEDLFIELLNCLSVALGYNFKKVHLKRGIYTPRAHGEADFAHRFIRDSLVRIFADQKSIPIKVTSLTYSEDTAKPQDTTHDSKTLDK